MKAEEVETHARVFVDFLEPEPPDISLESRTGDILRERRAKVSGILRTWVAGQVSRAIWVQMDDTKRLVPYHLSELFLADACPCAAMEADPKVQYPQFWDCPEHGTRRKSTYNTRRQQKSIEPLTKAHPTTLSDLSRITRKEFSLSILAIQDYPGDFLNIYDLKRAHAGSIEGPQTEAQHLNSNRAVARDHWYRMVPSEITALLEERGYSYRGKVTPRSNYAFISWERDIVEYNPNRVNYTVYLRAVTDTPDQSIIHYEVEDQIYYRANIISRHSSIVGPETVISRLEEAEARLREEAERGFVMSRTGHDNTGRGVIAARTYTTEPANETLPLYTHECPDCRFLGVANVGQRFDLYLCKLGGGPAFVVARSGKAPKAWAARDLAHAGDNRLSISGPALARAVQLAREQGLLIAPTDESNAARTSATSIVEKSIFTNNSLRVNLPPPRGQLQNAPLTVENFKVTAKYLEGLAPRLTSSLTALMQLAANRRAYFDRKGGNPTCYAVRQTDSSSEHILQLACALAANEGFIWSALLILPDEDTGRLQNLYRLADNFNNKIPVCIIDTPQMPSLKQWHHFVAISTMSTVRESHRLGYLNAKTFDLIICAEKNFHPLEKQEIYAQLFSEAQLIYIWTRFPRGESAPSNHTSEISIYPVTSHNPTSMQPITQTPEMFTSQTKRPARTSNVERPYKSFPPLSEMKIATISRIVSKDEDEGAQPGMYIVVPPHFPNECKAIRATLGYYARLTDDKQRVEDNFYVVPAPTVAAARELYEEARNSSGLRDFMISVRTHYGGDREPFIDRLDETAPVTCCCGARTVLTRLPEQAGGHFIASSAGWKYRAFPSPDIHLPIGWYCGQDGHYAEN